MATYADRVREQTTTTGTGTYTLNGAVQGFQTFVAGVGNGATVNYLVTNNTDWETGTGVVTDGSPDTLSRLTIFESSNNDNAVDWGVGTKDVYLTLPSNVINTLGASSPNPHFQTVTSSGVGTFGINTALNSPIIKIRDSGSVTEGIDLQLAYSAAGNRQLVFKASDAGSSDPRIRFAMAGSTATIDAVDSSNSYKSVYLGANNTTWGYEPLYPRLRATVGGTDRIIMDATGTEIYGKVTANNNIVAYSSGIFGKDVVVSGNASVGIGDGSRLSIGQSNLNHYTYASIPTVFFGDSSTYVRAASVHSLMVTSVWGSLPNNHSPQFIASINSVDIGSASCLRFWNNEITNSYSPEIRFQRVGTKKIRIDDAAGGRVEHEIIGTSYASGNVIATSSGIFGKDIRVSGDATFGNGNSSLFYLRGGATEIGNYYGSTGISDVGGNGVALCKGNLPGTTVATFNSTDVDGNGIQLYYKTQVYKPLICNNNMFTYMSGIFNMGILSSGNILSNGNVVANSSGIFGKDIRVSGDATFGNGNSSLFYLRGGATEIGNYYGSTGISDLSGNGVALCKGSLPGTTVATFNSTDVDGNGIQLYYKTQLYKQFICSNNIFTYTSGIFNMGILSSGAASLGAGIVYTNPIIQLRDTAQPASGIDIGLTYNAAGNRQIFFRGPTSEAGNQFIIGCSTGVVSLYSQNAAGSSQVDFALGAASSNVLAGHQNTTLGSTGNPWASVWTKKVNATENVLSYASGIFAKGIVSSGFITLNTNSAGKILDLTENGYQWISAELNQGFKLGWGQQLKFGTGAVDSSTNVGLVFNSTFNALKVTDTGNGLGNILAKDINASGNITIHTNASYSNFEIKTTDGDRGGIIRAYGSSFSSPSLANTFGFGPNSTTSGIVIFGNSYSPTPTSAGYVAIRGGGYESTADNIVCNGSYTTLKQTVAVSGRLIAFTNQIDFTQLPTSDPGVPGRLYRFGSGVFVSL